MFKRITAIGLLCLCFFYSEAIPKVSYQLSFPEPHTHYVRVRMEITDWSGDTLKVKMPVWTPGSYMLREFSRFVENFRAASGAKKIKSEKFRKNGWSVITAGSSSITIDYDVYAFELSVRTCFVDQEHAYLNGAGVFLYIDGMQSLPCTVKIRPYSEWKKISVALDRVQASDAWNLKAGSYDELIDAPFEIGNHAVFSFSAAGVPHEVAMFGDAPYDSVQISKDLAMIAERGVDIFGEHPCKRYVYIIHNLNTGGGGLEHGNSTTIQVVKTAYTPASYNNFLSLAAHEYFHLWNVKRLRPLPLGPFDYDNENYTSLLYMAEGFTSYYDELLMMRCGFVSRENYLSSLAGSISSMENSPGNDVQPVSEAGFDAWIKYYRSTENSGNSTISYYTKGSVLAALLDLSIINATDGGKSLDDVLRYMYNEYYKKLRRGFTDEELIRSVEKICSCSMRSFFENYIYDTDSIPYEKYFSLAGLKLSDKNAGNEMPFLGVAVTTNAGKVTVTSLERSGPAWKAGLNVNDEIIAVDGLRMGDDFVKFIGNHRSGESLKVTVSRAGSLKSFDITLVKSPKVSFALEKIENAGSREQGIYSKWLSAKGNP